MAKVLLISDDADAGNYLRELLRDASHEIITADRSGVLGVLYSESPDIIILNSPDAPALAREIKNDLYFNLIPILAVLSSPQEVSRDMPEWASFPVDDFLNLDEAQRELPARVRLALNRIRRVLDNNPLTRLPGNTSIRRRIEAALGTETAVCYIDINNFKPWNDRFGFKSGDDIIQVVARVTSNTVRAMDPAGFVGHIGGDDFVFVVALGAAEKIAAEIIAHFRGILKSFLPPEAADGFYKGKDRAGVERDLRVPALSIALVPANHPEMNHYLRITEAATLLNKKAKSDEAGGYLVYDG